MQNLLKIILVVVAGALASCKKHLEENTDAPGVHHPPNEKGAPQRTPAPENNPVPPAPATGSQGTVGTGNR